MRNSVLDSLRLGPFFAFVVVVWRLYESLAEKIRAQMSIKPDVPVATRKYRQAI